MPIFKIYSRTEPDYGRAYGESTNYYEAENIQTLIENKFSGFSHSSVTENKARLSKYFKFDECEQVIDIDLIEPILVGEPRTTSKMENHNEYY